MTTRPPADAIVALRSLERRYRALLAGRADDESPDDLVHRRGADGSSVAGHVQAVADALASQADALDAVLVTDGATVTDPPADHPATTTEGPVEPLLERLATSATHLADRAKRVQAKDWTRTGRTVSGQPRSAADILWDAVDLAVDHLRAAEAVLDEVRGRPS